MMCLNVIEPNYCYIPAGKEQMFRNHCVVHINVEKARLIQSHCFGLISLDHSHRQIATVSFFEQAKAVSFDRPDMPCFLISISGHNF